MGVSYNPKSVTNNLVFCLDAANAKSYGGTGTTWNDLSGKNNNGTLVNTVTYSTANSGRMVLNGGYITVANTGAVSNLSNVLSASVWVNPLIIDNNYRRFIAGDGFPNQKWYMEFNGVNIGKVLVGPGGYNSTITLTTNTWYNLTTVWNGTQSLLYINGVLDQTVSVAGPAFTANGIGIGADFNGSSPFNGYIAESRVYNKALTASEVRQNFNALRGRFGI